MVVITDRVLMNGCVGDALLQRFGLLFANSCLLRDPFSILREEISTLEHPFDGGPQWFLGQVMNNQTREQACSPECGQEKRKGDETLLD